MYFTFSKMNTLKYRFTYFIKVTETIHSKYHHLKIFGQLKSDPVPLISVKWLIFWGSKSLSLNSVYDDRVKKSHTFHQIGMFGNRRKNLWDGGNSNTCLNLPVD